MPYLRQKGKYWVLVDGHRDPATKKVKQRVLKYYGPEKPSQDVVDRDIQTNRVPEERTISIEDFEKYKPLISSYTLSLNRSKGLVNLDNRQYVIVGGLYAGTYQELYLAEVVPVEKYRGISFSYNELLLAGKHLYAGLKFHNIDGKDYVIKAGKRLHLKTYKYNHRHIVKLPNTC